MIRHILHYIRHGWDILLVDLALVVGGGILGYSYYRFVWQVHQSLDIETAGLIGAIHIGAIAMIWRILDWKKAVDEARKLKDPDA